MAAIKIVACIELDDLNDELLVANGILPEWFEGYDSHDLEIGPVKDFLEPKKLPWNEKFVSVFVLLPDDDLICLHDAFGHCFELDLDEILPSLVFSVF